MSNAELIPRKFTPEEYLTVERMATYRSEYVDGQLYKMAGGSAVHCSLAFNLAGIVCPQLKVTDCEGLSSDMKVRIGQGNAYYYPDLTIVCGEMRFHDEKQDVLLNPTCLVEVLSPSTETIDRVSKLNRYIYIESLRDYLLISQDTPRVDHFTRGEDGVWSSRIIIGLTARITLTGAPVTLTLAEIYDRITFPPAEE